MSLLLSSLTLSTLEAFFSSLAAFFALFASLRARLSSLLSPSCLRFLSLPLVIPFAFPFSFFFSARRNAAIGSSSSIWSSGSESDESESSEAILCQLTVPLRDAAGLTIQYGRHGIVGWLLWRYVIAIVVSLSGLPVVSTVIHSDCSTDDDRSVHIVHCQNSRPLVFVHDESESFGFPRLFVSW